MADNINRIRSRYPDEKIVYLAHNVHVSNNNKDYRTTGSWLKERFQDEYYIIGTCYFDGIDLFKRRALSGQTPLTESVNGSYEYLQVGVPSFFLDLSRLNRDKNPSSHWLTRPMLTRCYGVEPFIYNNEFSFTDLSSEYDGVLFIKTSIPLL